MEAAFTKIIRPNHSVSLTLSAAVILMLTVIAH